MMPPHLNSSAPWEELKKDPYVFNEVFSRQKDLKVILVKEIPEHNILIFEKKFDNSAEMAFVIYIEKQMNEITLKELTHRYKNFVLSLPNRNFREVEPIIIAKSFSDKAIEIIEEYNSKYEKRKPFRLFTYK